MKTKVASLALLLTLIFPIMAKSQVKIQQTAGRDALGEFAPEFARLNDDILFGPPARPRCARPALPCTLAAPLPQR